MKDSVRFQAPTPQFASAPADGSPFHAGEHAMQVRAGSRQRVEESGRRLIRDYLPDQHRQFFAQLPLFLVATVDAQGRPWASPLIGAPGFLHSPEPHLLHVAARPLCGDPLNETLCDGAVIGGLGIEFHTRRRNRVNGTVTLDPDGAGFTVRVTQSFGNCPQYIHARQWRVVSPSDRQREPGPVRRRDRLDAATCALITRADTFFIASSYADADDLRHGAETFFTSRVLRQIEDRVAQALADHLSLPPRPLLPHAQERAAQVATEEGLNADQAQALLSAVRRPVTIVTGGPGAGKSFFCRAVANLAARHHLSLRAGAPTDRAAQRLIELTSLPAMTLHRLLDFDPHTQRFQRNAECPLEAALVLVDEVSMVELFLFDALLAALPLGAHLVFLGDVDQLPSVGPGQVLADLIAAERVPVIHFTQIYRRAAGSTITASAHTVCAGILPILTDDPEAECRFIEVPDAQHAIARMVELVTDELPAATGCVH